MQLREFRLFGIQYFEDALAFLFSNFHITDITNTINLMKHKEPTDISPIQAVYTVGSEDTALKIRIFNAK